MSFLPESFKTMRLCRGCLSTENDLQPLFVNGTEELFQRLTSIQISADDGLPTLLCANCVKILNEHNTFRLLCISSNVILQKRLKLIAREKSFMLEIESSPQPKPKVAPIVATVAAVADENAPPVPPSMKKKRHRTKRKRKSKQLASNGTAAVNYVEFQAATMCPPSNGIANEATNSFENSSDNAINLIAEQSRTPNKMKESSQRQPLSIGFNHITEEWQPCVLIRKISANIDLETTHCIKYPFTCHVCYGCFERKDVYDSHLLAHETKSNWMQLNIKTEPEIEIRDMDTSPLATSMHVVPADTKSLEKSFIFGHLTDTKSILNIDDITNRSPAKHPIQFAAPKRHRPKSKPDQQYTCDMCIANDGSNAPKIFATKTALQSHMSMHIIRLRTCELCGRKCSDSVSLELHIATHHGTIIIDNTNENGVAEEQLLKCDVCDKKFHWDHQLQYHRNIHRDQKLISCSLCTKKFANTIALRRHLHMHNLPLHRCNTCPAKFKTLKEMRDHRSECGDTGAAQARRFVCTNCGRTFASRSGLGIHANLKKCQLNGKYVFFCTTCGRKFLTQVGLNVHKSKRLCFK